MGKKASAMTIEELAASLSLQRKAAADYFIQNGGNKMQAALQAGYSKSYAKGNANTIFENEKVRAYLDIRLDEIQSNRVAKNKEVMEYLTSVMRGENKEEVVVVEGTGTGCSQAITKKKELQPKDRLKAAEMLCKIYGDFVTKVEAEVEVKKSPLDELVEQVAKNRK